MNAEINQPITPPVVSKTAPLKPENLQFTSMMKTMLRGVYNRAAEAARPDTLFHDSTAIQIARKIEFDYLKQFGKPTTGQVTRAMTIDHLLRQWLVAYPAGQVVALGDGLETQVTRVDNGQVKWLSIDLPEVVSIRTRFLPDTERRRSLACSALDTRWMYEINPNEPVFITAAGLFKFFQPKEVRGLLASIATRFRNSEVAFDVIPRLVSEFSVRGWLVNGRHYTEPTMPFGLDRHEKDSIKTWNPAISEVRDVALVPARGTREQTLKPTLRKQPWIGDHVFWMALVRCHPRRTAMLKH